MNTQSAVNRQTTGETIDLTQIENMVIPGMNEGDHPLLVVYEPVHETLLLRDHPTKRYAYVYDMIPMGEGRYARGQLLSASLVDVGAAN